MHVYIYTYAYICIYEYKDDNEEVRQRSKPKGEEEPVSIIGKESSSIMVSVQNLDLTTYTQDVYENNKGDYWENQHKGKWGGWGGQVTMIEKRLNVLI